VYSVTERVWPGKRERDVLVCGVVGFLLLLYFLSLSSVKKQCRCLYNNLTLFNASKRIIKQILVSEDEEGLAHSWLCFYSIYGWLFCFCTYSTVCYGSTTRYSSVMLSYGVLYASLPKGDMMYSCMYDMYVLYYIVMYVS
jgi:hypothetical protein